MTKVDLQVVEKRRKEKEEMIRNLELVAKVDTLNLISYTKPKEDYRSELMNQMEIDSDSAYRAVRAYWNTPQKTAPYSRIIVSPDYLKVQPSNVEELRLLINRVMYIIGCPEYHIERMDLALDCFQENMYDNAYKMSHTVFKCLSMIDNIKNTYDVRDINGKKRSLMAAKDKYTLNFYDKHEQDGSDIGLRAEFREKVPSQWEHLENIFVGKWKSLFNKVYKNYDEIITKENERLVEVYRNGLLEHPYWQIDWSSFVLENEIYIHNRKQMYDLVDAINQLDDGWHWTNESKSRINKFCTRNPQIMFISKKFVYKFMALMLDAMSRYFVSKWEELSHFEPLVLDALNELEVNARLLLPTFEGVSATTFQSAVSTTEIEHYLEVRDFIGERLVDVAAAASMNFDEDDIASQKAYDIKIDVLQWMFNRVNDKLADYDVPEWVPI